MCSKQLQGIKLLVVACSYGVTTRTSEELCNKARSACTKSIDQLEQLILYYFRVGILPNLGDLRILANKRSMAASRVTSRPRKNWRARCAEGQQEQLGWPVTDREALGRGRSMPQRSWRTLQQGGAHDARVWPWLGLAGAEIAGQERMVGIGQSALEASRTLVQEETRDLHFVMDSRKLMNGTSTNQRLRNPTRFR